MPNRYTPDNNYILADDGRKFAVDTWHPMPTPEGITMFPEDDEERGFKANANKSPSAETHWLIRRPLPPIPKTLDQLDSEAFYKWWRDGIGSSGSLGTFNPPQVNHACETAFKAGISHARKPHNRQ